MQKKCIKKIIGGMMVLSSLCITTVCNAGIQVKEFDVVNSTEKQYVISESENNLKDIVIAPKESIVSNEISAVSEYHFWSYN